MLTEIMYEIISNKTKNQAKQNNRTDSNLPIIMGCGSLFTPTPALVLAATSTRYWIPGYRPPITTDRMAASTVLLI